MLVLVWSADQNNYRTSLDKNFESISQHYIKTYVLIKYMII